MSLGALGAAQAALFRPQACLPGMLALLRAGRRGRQGSSGAGGQPRPLDSSTASPVCPSLHPGPREHGAQEMRASALGRPGGSEDGLAWPGMAVAGNSSPVKVTSKALGSRWTGVGIPFPRPTSYANLGESLSLSEPTSPLQMGEFPSPGVLQGLHGQAGESSAQRDPSPCGGSQPGQDDEGRSPRWKEGAGLAKLEGGRCEGHRGAASALLGRRRRKVLRDMAPGHPRASSPACRALTARPPQCWPLT